MKLDGEQVLCEGNTNSTHDFKPFEHNNNCIMDVAGVNSADGAPIQEQNDNLYKRKDRESEANVLPHCMENENNWSNLKYDTSKDVKDMNISAQLTHSSPGKGSFETSRVLCVDKAEMQHEVPKVVVICCEESTYVKDICIVDAVLSEYKHLVDSDVTERRVCSSVSSVDDIENEMAKERFNVSVPDEDMHEPFSDGRKQDPLAIRDSSVYSYGKDAEKDTFRDHHANNSIKTREIMNHKSQKPENKPSENVCSLGDLLTMSQLDIVDSRIRHNRTYKTSVEEASQMTLQTPRKNEFTAEASGHEDLEVGNQGKISICPVLDHGDSQGSTAKKDVHVSAEVFMGYPIPVSDESDDTLDLITLGMCNCNAEGKLASHALDSTSEESTSVTAPELSLNSKVETASMAFGTAPSASDKICARKNFLGSNNIENQHVLDSSRLEDDTGPTTVSNIEESSFSAAGPLSALITYSGPIAFSGSISRRSDSSTTSTRSFAFPILQSEWNSSPMRMAKADRRLCRKHRWWRDGLLCCKF